VWESSSQAGRRGVASPSMAQVLDGIDAKLAAWIEEQPVFFVATAPLAGDGLVNVSPKGTRGTYRVLGEHTFAYLDLTGSGIETLAHLQENGRICVMFCAFDGGPKIVRLHGTGRVVLAGDPGFAEAVAPFAGAAESRRPQTRGVVVVDVTRVATACGYAVPHMDFVEERDVLDAWAQTRGEEKLARYHAQKNARSIDGLPGLPVERNVRRQPASA
jgi:predicted pyridoxine 5'-phosphate oxidase superfamily flavin-nucleotide-binding protein